MFLMASRKRILGIISFYTIIGADLASIYGGYQLLILKQTRAEGFFSHALTYGNTLSMIFCLIITYLIAKSYRNRNDLIFYTFSAILVFIGMATSVSKGPMLASLITVALMITILFRLKGFLISLLFMAVFVGIIFTVPSFKARYIELTDSSWKDPSTATGVRPALWRASLKIIKDHPLFGIGERNFRQTAKKYINGPMATMAHAHNAYLQFALTHGLIAFMILLLLLIKLLYDTISGALSGYSVGLMGVSILTVFLLASFTENTLGDSEVAMLFYFLLGTICGELYRAKLGKGKNEEPRGMGLGGSY
jgi:O-antigen ligase